ncbi:MAG: Putative metal chaperone YciC [Alphaproteobacteria bacterium]|nr:MAG: Putative metal chaperone YciC [Alphaproteobacteria bacterium]
MNRLPQIPLTIISGFLGSGKTSLLNHLLTQSGLENAPSEKSGRRITAMVNDFGALNIDAELIAAKHGNQIALANGCVCCSIGDDLMRSFMDVMQQSPLPDHIVIEASGVAEPRRIAGFASVDPQLRLDGIVTLVDASAHNVHSKDPYLADNYAKQIEAAHLLLISKPDLADTATLENLESELAAQKPDVPMAHVTHGVLPIDLVLGLNGDHKIPQPQEIIEHGFVQWAGHLTDIPRAALIAKLENLRPHVLRAKGVLRDAEGAYVLHLAGGLITTAPYAGKASGHFVIIGQPQMPDAAALEKIFRQNEAA